MGSQQRNVAMITRFCEIKRKIMPVFLSNRKVSIVDIMFLTSFLLLHCATSTLAMAYHNHKFEPSPQTNSIFPSNHHIQNSPKFSDSSVTKLPSNLQSSHLSTSSNKNKHGVKDIKVYYQSGNSEASLPVCSPNSVCNKLDTYSSPWVEKQCRCPQGMNSCSTSTHIRDGHTITDRNRQYKVCEPVKTLKKCKYFRDVTWTYISYPDNSTQQIMHCRCPKNSVAYLIKRHAYQTVTGTGYQYSFACSPQTKIKCQRKEPCKLFSVRKNYDRPTADEVNTSSLCQCPHKKKCPKHHLDVGVIPGKIYSDDSVRTYSAYCM